MSCLDSASQTQSYSLACENHAHVRTKPSTTTAIRQLYIVTLPRARAWYFCLQPGLLELKGASIDGKLQPANIFIVCSRVFAANVFMDCIIYCIGVMTSHVNGVGTGLAPQTNFASAFPKAKREA